MGQFKRCSLLTELNVCSLIRFVCLFIRKFVAVPPRFVEKPEVYHMGYETWDTTISCNIFGYPPPVIRWTRSFRSLSTDRHKTTGKDLIIKETQREDKGPIMCRGDNHLGHVYALIVLVVNPVCEYL